MKKPFLKKVLSHFTELILEESGSEYNPVLQVLLNKGRYQLCTESAIYSYEDKYDNFYESFEKLDIQNQKIESVLLLGLGLGSIPYMLEKNFSTIFDYTAVEIDEEICRLAHKYVLKELKSRIEVFPLDANAYLSMFHETFDMINMDIFQSAEIPAEFQSEEFLQTLKGRLNKQGLLLYNRLADTPQNVKEADKFSQLWKQVFPIGGFIKVKQNHIYFNDMTRVKK